MNRSFYSAIAALFLITVFNISIVTAADNLAPAQVETEGLTVSSDQMMLRSLFYENDQAGSLMPVASQCTDYSFPYFCNSNSYGQLCCSERYYNPCDQRCYSRSSDITNCSSYVRCSR